MVVGGGWVVGGWGVGKVRFGPTLNSRERGVVSPCLGSWTSCFS